MGIADKVIAVAKGEVGTHEGRSGGRWNNHQKYSPAVPGLEWSQDQAWCCTFCAWVAMTAGAADLYPRTASCDAAAEWFRKKGRVSEYPAIGAQVFYGSSADYVHTGIVTAFDETYIYTVEGNTNTNGSREGDGVYEKTRRRRDDYVALYGYPEFPEGIVSADPKFAHEAPKKAAPAAPEKPKETPYQRVSRIAHQRLVKIRNLQKRLRKAKKK